MWLNGGINLQQVLNMTCPGCGAPVAVGQKVCEYGHPVTISTFNSVYSMPMPEINKYANAYRKVLSQDPDNKDINTSIAFCYLKLKLFDKALPSFEKAIEDNFDNPETFFYAAVCLLAGKKAFVQQRSTIDKIIEYINAAIMIEPLGIYYYFLAYIKYDYFKRKFLKVSPSYEDDLATALSIGVSDFDIEQLFLILNVDNPF